MMARILLVEDDDALRVMLKVLLTGAGHEVWEAADGTRICDVYQQQRFDLVITELVMPNVEGLEVIMELRRTDPNVRIIAMSGVGKGRDEEYLRIARKVGAQVTLSKPFGNEQFLEAVRSALETSTN